MITRRMPILIISQHIKNLEWKEILIGGANNGRLVVLTESNLIYLDGFYPESSLELETLLPRRFRKTNWSLYAFSTRAICLASYEDSNPKYLLYDRVKREWEQITRREDNRLKEFEEQAESETECFIPIRWDLD